MKFGEIARKRLHILTFLAAALTLFAAPQAVLAQEAEQAEAVVEAAVVDETAAETPGFEYYGPDMIKGQPSFAEDGLGATMTFQPQHTADGEYALLMHDALLMPVIVIICLFVLALLLWVVVRFNRKANPVASKTSHNTLIEIIWTGIPIIILLVISVPSIKLLSSQFESPPEDAITIKANGYQWYWVYQYPDNGGFEVISNMMDEDEAVERGLPPQLAADNRLVVPVGTPIRLQTFGADVIHSFGVPSLWFKLDAVPGRINEKMLTIDEPGIYYGQCMELCGALHGYMPIAIEARPRAEYDAWVLSQGGTIGGEEEAVVEEIAADDTAEAPEAAAAES